MNELVTINKEIIFSTGLKLDDGLPYKTWEKYVSQAKEINKFSLWILGDLLNYGERNYGEMYAQVLDEFDYEYGTLRVAKFVCKQIELLRRRNNLSFSMHREAASLEPDKQDELLKEAEENRWTVKELRLAVRKSGQKLRQVKLPEGKFNVVVIDPPWEYNREYDPETSRVASPYPEINQEELLKLEIPFADDSVLFLWATHRFIWDAKELMNNWGFEYKANLVWDKEKMGMGMWLRMQCEFCLIGIKGKPIWDNTTFRDIIREPRREHSRKPEAFYNMVNNICYGSKLDYFSRNKREGWTVFGNDLEKFSVAG